MSLRSILIGAVGVLFIAVFAYPSTTYAAVNLGDSQLPRFVFGLLVLGVLVVNPLLWRLRRGWCLSSSELATVFVLMLVATHFAGPQLVSLYSMITLPAHINLTNPGWNKSQVLSYAPPQLLVGAGAYEPRVLEGFLSGLAGQKELVKLDALPWGDWVGPLAWWGVLFGLGAAACIGMGLVVHRHWSNRERLRYPIAQFASALIEQEGGRPWPSLLGRRLFWLGLSAILILRGVNVLHSWFPNVVGIPLSFNFSQILPGAPRLARMSGSGEMVVVHLVPAIIAFSFFLAADVSFSLGISLAVFVYGGWVLQGMDISMWDAAGYAGFGASVGVAVALVYVGRRYYWQVLRAAMGLKPRDHLEGYAAWACRLFLAATGGMVLVLVALGLDWTLAVFAVAALMLMYLVTARMVAESGVFFLSTLWTPAMIGLGLFGPLALGPEGMIFVAFIALGRSIALMRDVLPPMIVNGLRIADSAGVKPARVAWEAAGAYVVAGLVAGVVTLWFIYSRGIQQNDWMTYRVPTFAFDMAKGVVDRLTLTDQLGESLALTPLQRVARIRPQPVFLWMSGIGFTSVLVTTALRLRLVWWPIHPILFLVLGAVAVRIFWASYLLGCLIKVMVTRFGGSKAYHATVPLMMGILAGDMVAALLYNLIAWGYYLRFDLIPRGYPGV